MALAQAPFPVWPEGGKAPPSMDPREERRRELLPLPLPQVFLLFVLLVGGLKGRYASSICVRTMASSALSTSTPRSTGGNRARDSAWSRTAGPMTINGRGYRGPELPAQKNRTRVVVLGDSVGFGRGAGDDETSPISSTPGRIWKSRTSRSRATTPDRRSSSSSGRAFPSSLIS